MWSVGPIDILEVKESISWARVSPQSARFGELYLSVPAVDAFSYEKNQGQYHDAWLILAKVHSSTESRFPQVSTAFLHH